MFRIARIVPTIVLTATALALAAPVAQAKPYIAPSGGAAYVSPNVQSTRVFKVYGSNLVHRDVGSVVVTTGDMPLKNPVQGSERIGALHRNSETLGAGFVHANSVGVPVAVPASSSNGFDWAAAALGAGLASILVLMLGVSVGFRRRGHLAA
jgi:hypothetical protein